MTKISLEDYINFCSSWTGDCEHCPLQGDEVTGTYYCCLGCITEHPEYTENIITNWKRQQIEERKSIFLVVEKYNGDTEVAISGMATTRQMAEEMLEKIAKAALEDCLAIDSEESGIYWDSWTAEERETFYEEDVKASWFIVEKKLDTYTLNGEVAAI